MESKSNETIVLDTRSKEETFLDKIFAKMHDLTIKYFPEDFFESSGYSGPTFHRILSGKNRYYQGSEFFYKGKYEFFHLTSIKSLFSIINERALRFYNLNNSDDEAEYTFPATQLRMTEDQIKYSKENLFSFSFCSMGDLSNKNVWEVYGDNFKNVAIIFEITNKTDEWENFHMSNVKYKLSKNISDFITEKIELETTNSGIKIEIDLSKLISFYKAENWIADNEIRIITYIPFKYYDEKQKYVKTEFKVTEERQRIVKYFKLPLWVDNNSAYVKSGFPELDRRHKLPSDYFIKRPEIRIKQIVFGENANIKEHILLSKVIQEMIRKNFGYQISITS